jgi:6-phosphofructokinase 1
LKTIGIVTAGGDAPGMNAAIRSVVRSALHHGLKVIGFERGYTGLLNERIQHMESRSVGGIINLGGTILRTTRCKEIKTTEGVEKGAKVLGKFGIDGLVAIGGDGTFRGASKLHKTSGIPTIGIPATIDNDVSGTDTTIGFDTAINTALQAIDNIRNTATSLERIFVVEVMGRKRGFLALEAGLAGGAELILIPEIEYDIDTICERLKHDRDKGKNSEIIVKAEGGGDSNKVVNSISKKTGFEVRLTVLGHIQRGGIPTAQSRALACVFGHHAVEMLLKGEKKSMVAIQGGQVVSIDLEYSWKVKKDPSIDRLKLAELLSM